jgi:hypothetical protein
MHPIHREPTQRDPIMRSPRSPFSCAVILRAAALRDRLLRARRTLPACALAGAVATLPGCIAVGGTARHESPTLGRQLIDLKAAYDSGALSEAEYNAAKSQILQGNGR